jgi:hypothetical protein
MRVVRNVAGTAAVAGGNGLTVLGKSMVTQNFDLQNLIEGALPLYTQRRKVHGFTSNNSAAFVIFIPLGCH